MQEEFQDRLLKFRKVITPNASAFARSIELTQPVYCNYEKGQRRPAFEILEKMARIHNVNLNWLLTGEGEMFDSPPTKKLRDSELKICFKNFGGKLNKLQNENDLSIIEVAEILGISEDDFVDYCLARKKPDLDIVLKIISKFDVDFDWFLK